jgi:RNA polymerase sigma factor (sigma-70 family)
MPGGTSAVVLKNLHTLFQVGTAGGLTDGQLIERFLSQRDDVGEAAFRALVERHAPMVLRVCRDVVHDWHEAEDAAQATFIVLASKAGSIHKRESVASWLFGVACRVAAQAKAKSARRRRHEERRAELAAATIAQEDLHMPWLELYEEIDRLPERLRGPLVLCYLKGHSQPEAAAWLGCPVRTLQNRLTQGQERLRSRLTRRGMHSEFGLWAASLDQGMSSAPVPVAWFEKTVQAALVGARHASTAGLLSASVASLTEGMLRMMFRTKLKSIVAGVLAAAMLTVGMGMLAILAAGAPAQDKRAGRETKTAPRVAGGEIIVGAVDFSRDRREEGLSGTVAIDPETGNWRPIYKGLALTPGRASPDGRYFVYSSLGDELPDDEVGIWVYDMTGKIPARRIFERKGQPFWTNNGRQVVIGMPIGKQWEKFETWRVNADGTGRTKLPIPDTDLVLDCSRDGTWLATRTISGEPRHRGRLTLVHPDGTGARHLTEGSANDDLFFILQISPDGRNVACVEIKTVNDVRHSTLFVVDIDGHNRREIPIAFEPGMTVGVCWSPDGSRLALNALDSKTKEGSIALVDLDGSNYRKLLLPPGRWNLHICDWQAITPELKVGAPDDTPDLKTPRGRYTALLQEIDKAVKIHDDASRKAKTQEERSRIYQEKFPHAKLYAGRFLAIAESAPSDPAGVDALVRVVTFGDDGPEFSRAIDLLAERHAESRKGGHAALVLTGKAAPAAEKLMRAVIEKNPDQYIKGLACLALGQYLKHQSDRVRDIRDDPEAAKAWEAIFLEEGSDKESFTRFRGRDPDAMMKESDAIFERIGKEFGGVTNQDDRLSKHAFATLVADADAELYEIRNLRVGEPAPEITGEDIDGKPFKLSDYRGKVVYLSFWAEWCGSCRAMVPLERSLVEKMRGKPFVLLGVNGDSDKDKLRELMKRENITWRSWCDGGGSANTPGPIARQFHVNGWPTVYVIDDLGVVRLKLLGNPGSKNFNSAIDALVADAVSKGVSDTDQAKAPSGAPASAPAGGRKPRS